MSILNLVYEIKYKPLIKGISTFAPGLNKHLLKSESRSTISSEYCYGVWMKHLVLSWKNGMRSLPKTIAELGPGDSLGIGLAAMICGANKYYALDVEKFSDIKTNLRVFDELVDLFQKRSSRPTKGWPDFDDEIDENLFPSHILTDDILQSALNEDRLSAIRNEIEFQKHDNPNAIIKYMAPWYDINVIKPDSIDFVLSQSVLEHVTDLQLTYKSLYSWLKPGGIMSHQIDFTSHGLSKSWNGYRAYPEFIWKLFVGKRLFLINREPYSEHIEHIKSNKFTIFCNLARLGDDGIKRKLLSEYWQNISDHDLSCSGAFIQASK